MTTQDRLRGLARRVTGRGPRVIDVTEGALAGARLKVDGPGPSTYSGPYEAAFAAALLRLAVPGAYAVDAGAHEGYFSVLLGRAVGPQGRVVAFEPDPANARRARENAELNGLGDRIRVEVAALSDTEAPAVELFAGRAGATTERTLSRAFAEREQSGAGVIGTTRVTTLDAVFAETDRLDLVKMDIEGAEAQALAGACTVLATHRPAIVLEFHREVGWPAIEVLREAGYRLETLEGVELPWPSGPDAVPYQLVALPC